MEQRLFQRAVGELAVRWHVGSGEAIGRWLSGAPPAGPEHEPEPDMNFGAGGVAFDGPDRPREGELLFLELAVPGEATFRGAGLVLRVSPVPIDERDNPYRSLWRVAVKFVVLAKGGSEALDAYTHRLRQANGPA